MRGFNDGRESLHSNNGNIVPRKVWHEEVKARVASAKRTVRSSTPFIPEFRKRSHAWLIQPSRLLYPSIKMPNIYKFLFSCEHLQKYILGALLSTLISLLLLKVIFFRIFKVIGNCPITMEYIYHCIVVADSARHFRIRHMHGNLARSIMEQW